MLTNLEINNIAIIDKINLELGFGLNILTGETGAGKSIVIDSINAILGERLTKDLIRSGKEKASVQAIFDVDNDRLKDIFEELDIEHQVDNTLIISREFTVSSKNICRVNNKMVTVSVLKKIGERLIDIHGQNDNQSLLRTENHIDLLDLFGGEEISKLKKIYLQNLNKFRNLKLRLKELSGDNNERERKIDLLRYKINEIHKAKLNIGEDELQEKQKTTLLNSEKIISSLNAAYGLTFSGRNANNSAFDNINEAIKEISFIAKLDPCYEELSKKLEEVSFQLEDVTDQIRIKKDESESNPKMLEDIEERLDQIYKLKKKYGKSIEDIQKYCAAIEIELDNIIKSERSINSLKEKIELLDQELYEVSNKLNILRAASACSLEDKISNELEDLEMKKTKFKVNIIFDESKCENAERKYSNSGLDKVEFLISTNPGEPLKPLSKIVSGGEMSRVMLAIKTILANVDSIPTLIFDEITPE